MYSGAPSSQSPLAADGTHVYFRTNTAVEACPATAKTCVPTSIWTTTHPLSNMLTAATGYVFWNDGSVIYGCTSTSCTPTQYLDTSATSGTLYAIGSALGSKYLWAVAQDTTPNINVWQMGLDDTSPSPRIIITYDPGPAQPNLVAATPASSRVIWSTASTPTLYVCQDPTSCAMAPSGNTTSTPSPLALVATPSALYVASAVSGVWYTTDLSLASGTSHFAGSNQIFGLAANGTSTTIFYAEQSAIFGCPTSGTSCQMLYQTTGSIGALAADNTAIYWIEGPKLMRLVL